MVHSKSSKRRGNIRLSQIDFEDVLDRCQSVIESDFALLASVLSKVLQIPLKKSPHHISLMTLNRFPLELIHHFLDLRVGGQPNQRVLILHQAQLIEYIVI